MAKPISRLHYLPFGAEKARTTTSPVSANHLFSMSRRAEGCVKGSVGPFQLKISEGVTDCIALASSGGGEEASFFANYRPLPLLSGYEHGVSNVPGGRAKVSAKKTRAARIGLTRIVP